ncbi:MAG: DUF4163 domain-containing protein [Eubacterium sp.]|nr:DUF4163 domain-containing protein [Eubacterium sp.]
MKKLVKALGAGALLVVLTLSCGMAMTESVSAKVGYTKKAINKNEQFGTIKAEVGYQLVQLKGDSPAIKKINKALKKDYKKFMKGSNAKEVKSYAEETSKVSKEEDTYYWNETSSVKYNKNGVISIVISTQWYAGGVSNVDLYGLNFDVETGKKLYVNQVCGKSTKYIKNKLYKALKKSFEADADYEKVVDTVKNKRTKKIRFYIKKNGKVMVSFEPYELLYGGWYREFKVGKINLLW